MKAMGAGLVIGSSTNADRRARLAGFGADLTIDEIRDVVEAVAYMTANRHFGKIILKLT